MKRALSSIGRNCHLRLSPVAAADCSSRRCSVSFKAFVPIRRQLSSFCSKSPDDRPPTYRPRRALLYVPASSQKMIDKVATMKADCVVLELEDGVALSSKPLARRNAVAWLNDRDKHGSLSCQELGLRFNSVSSGLIEDDVKSVASASHQPDCFMIPKVDSIDDLHAIYETFKSHFGAQTLAQLSHKKDIRWVGWIESAQALIRMPDILAAARNLHKSVGFFRLDGVVFGSDDYCADIGAERSSIGDETLYARQRFVCCAKAFGLQAIDSVYIDIKDTDGLKKQSDQGFSWGFTGKQVIHPSQVPIVHESFTPSKQRFEWAQQLVAEFEQHQQSGKGAFTFRGHMIDRPLLLQAHNVLQMAKTVNQ